MEEKPKIDSIKSKLKIALSVLIIVFIIFVLASYLINSDFRNTVDTKIFKKEVSENTSSFIEINSDDNPEIYAFDKYVTVLSKNKITYYDQTASLVTSLDLNITTPYITSNGSYLAVAENGGNKLYLFSGTEIKWDKDVDGQIYRVSVNENGFVSVLLKNTTYKSIVVVYDFDGNELFRTYLATSYALCAEISGNNKYLAIGQIDYSGTIVKSVVKLISIEKVKEDAENSVIYTYESEMSKILNNVKFNTHNEVICIFDSYIQKITENADEKIYDIEDSDIFVDINLANYITIVQKETSGLFSYEYQVNLKNTTGKSDNLYILDNNVPKKLQVNNNLICMTLPNEVRIINASGWLVKRYTSKTEIQDIVIGDSVMGIVYNNKIEVISL